MIFVEFLLISAIGGLIAALIHLLFEQSREIRTLKRQSEDLRWQLCLVDAQLETVRMVLIGELHVSDLIPQPEDK